MGKCLASADTCAVVDNQIFYWLVIQGSPQGGNQLNSPYTSSLLALFLSTSDFVSVHNEHAALQLIVVDTNAIQRVFTHANLYMLMLSCRILIQPSYEAQSSSIVI
jgi:hypothetical protein